MKKLLISMVLIPYLTGSFAQSIADYLSVPFPSNLRSSKDGQKIAWVFNDKGVRNIYMAESPFTVVKPVTRFKADDGMDIGSLQFSPDGNRILFVRGNAPNPRGEPANPGHLQLDASRVIYMVDAGKDSIIKIGGGYSPTFSPDGRKVAYLNQSAVWISDVSVSHLPEKLFTSRGIPSSLKWAPDGTKLAFVSARGDHSFIGIYDFRSGSHSFLDASVDKDIEPAFSRDGRKLAWIRVPYEKDIFPFIPQREGLPWSIRMMDLGDGSVRQVWKADAGKGSVLFDGLPVMDNLILWSAGDQIIFPWEKDGWVHLYQIDPYTGNPKLITPGNGEVENVMLSTDGNSLFYTTNIGDIDRRHIWKRDLKGNINKQVTKGDGIEWSPVQTQTGLVVLRSTATRPGWPATVDADGSVKDIFPEGIPASFPGNALISPKAVQITARDGMKVPAQLFLPRPNKNGEKHPALIFFHGGSRRQMLLGFNYGMYYSHAYALNQYFTSKGYIVLSVNYRSGIGYGLDFREAINYGADGASEFNDVIGAGRYLQGMEQVDPRRIALWGGSYGGFLTAMGLCQASDMFACGVDIHGVHDWNVVIKNFSATFDTEKHTIVAKKARESSPLHFIDGWKSPVLLIHGDDDRNVPFSETVDLAEQLRKRKVPFQQLVLPDEVHSFLLHRNWVKAFEESYRFISEKFKQ